jgi:hypothetical protein
MKIEFELSVGLVRGQGPSIEISVNNNVEKTLQVNVPATTETVTIDNNKHNVISIRHFNKSEKHDTVVKDGTILEDKFVKVTKIWVDDILLPLNLLKGQVTPEYFLNYLKSIDFAPLKTYSDNAIYFNGTIEYTIQQDFFNYLHNYIKKTELDHIDNLSVDNLANITNETNTKYFGYVQDAKVLNQIIEILTENGYSITS